MIAEVARHLRSNFSNTFQYAHRSRFSLLYMERFEHPYGTHEMKRKATGESELEAD